MAGFHKTMITKERKIKKTIAQFEDMLASQPAPEEPPSDERPDLLLMIRLPSAVQYNLSI